MNRISDALELLTSQHDQLDALLTKIAADGEEDVRRGLVYELAELLTGHLAIEQQVFYPAVAHQLSVDVLGELLTEHAEIKRALADLVWCDTVDDRFGASVTQLQRLLAGHAAWQDDQLFVPMSEAMTSSDLERLGAHMSFWFDGSSTQRVAA